VSEAVAPNEYPAEAMAAFDPPAPDAALVAALRARGVEVDDSTAARARHARDWWPITIGEAARGRVPAWPTAVARPTSVDLVAAAVSVAHEVGVAVTAQGGRSGVEGGAAAPEGALALDLTGLDRVLEVDVISLQVRVQAGVRGPALETALRAHGLTAGHFPQSFELATVGGWLACRGAGQYSNRYGTAADLVRALTVVLADGAVVEVGSGAPRQAVGPDLVGLFVGSEGALGVIVEATIQVARRAPAERRGAYLFADFDRAMEACRDIVQRGARPAVLRLYDETESLRHFEVAGCALIVLDEGEAGLVDAQIAIVADACASARALDGDLVERWVEHRNDVSALAPLWERGICVDTLEVSGPWSALSSMREAALSALRALEGTLLASVHQSHAYPDGACLYFTFAGRPPGSERDYYRAAWAAATRAVLASGGSLSHHHGVGRNRARFVAEALGSGARVLETLKEALDPTGTLNPGVLGLGGPPW
jgi:alkyldihydroxyacetonephosphate synthase